MHINRDKKNKKEEKMRLSDRCLVSASASLAIWVCIASSFLLFGCLLERCEKGLVSFVQ